MRMLTTASAFVIAAALMGTQATAQPTFSTETKRAKPTARANSGEPRATVVVCLPQTPGPHETIRVHSTIRTRWLLLDPLASWGLGRIADYDKDIDTVQDRWFELQPLGNAQPTNLLLETSVPMKFRILPTPSPADAVDLIIIRPVDPVTGELLPDSRCDKPKNDKPDPYQRLLGGKLIEREVLPGTTTYFRSDAHELRLQTGPRSIGKPGMWFSFVVTNTGDRSYPPTDFAMSDGHSNTNYLIAWRLADGTKDLPAELAPGETLRGALLARNAAQLRKGFVVHLHSTPGVVAADFGWEKEPEPEPVNHGRLTIHAQGTLGAVSLANGSNADQNEFTGLRGGGALAVYGLSGYLSLEGGLSLLASGDARFDDDSRADARSMRALFGVRVHVGETYVPYLRVGLGFRLGQYTWRPADGAESSDLQGGGLWGVAGGFDAWLGDNVVIGVSAGYVGPFGGDDDSYAFEAGAHAGYAWTP